jgi:hypothetical protein
LSYVYSFMYSVIQGLTLVHFSGQLKHCLWDTLGTFSIYVGHNS